MSGCVIEGLSRCRRATGTNSVERSRVYGQKTNTEFADTTVTMSALNNHGKQKKEACVAQVGSCNGRLMFTLEDFAKAGCNTGTKRSKVSVSEDIALRNSG